MRSSGKSLNKSLDRALDLLELLSAHETPLRSVEIARELDVAPNTANNMLRVLFRRGYLSQDEAGRYYPGPQCHFLSNLPSLFRLLQDVAEPYMKGLSRETGGNAFLGAEESGKLYMVVRTEGDGAVRVTHEQLWHDKFHCTAVGKIILAEKGLGWLQRITEGRRLTRLTPKTITRAKDIEAMIAEVRERGFAIADRESNEELYAYGVPVRDKTGSLIAGIGQSVPYYYVETNRIDVDARIRALTETAQRIGSSSAASVARLWRTGNDHGKHSQGIRARIGG